MINCLIKERRLISWGRKFWQLRSCAWNWNCRSCIMLRYVIEWELRWFHLVWILKRSMLYWSLLNKKISLIYKHIKLWRISLIAKIRNQNKSLYWKIFSKTLQLKLVNIWHLTIAIFISIEDPLLFQNYLRLNLR